MNQHTDSLEPKKVSDLLQTNFFIESYQRGYRWSDTQVSKLLDDINDFVPQVVDSSSQATSWYCLQPLVVKQMDNLQKAECQLSEQETWYEVIDGQQRLTTLFLIIHYANQMWSGFIAGPEPTIQYKTRPGSADFLKKLAVDSNNSVEVNKSNIDYYNMSNGYKKIHQWVLEKNTSGAFCAGNFISKILEYTKVIWYEVSQTEKPIEVFTRLNMGKIRLTNSELIKALLLSESSISAQSTEELRLKRLEIASEWDIIENELNNPNLWSFITNNKQQNYPTKIELLLEVSAPKADTTQEFGVFDYYFLLWQKSGRDIKQLWERVVSDFEILKEWYHNNQLYHKVGYLITLEGSSGSKKLSELLDLFKQCTKKEFESTVLLQEIKDSISEIDIRSINYNNNKPELHKILTLFNIVTTMNANGSVNRYPFNLHKNSGCWSLEHIHAQKSAEFKTEKEWRGWLTAHLEVLKRRGNQQVLCLEIESALKLDSGLVTKDIFDSFHEMVIDAMSAENDKDEVHGIENMALLAKDDNSTLNKATFEVKRQRVLEMDKLGSYIPICTRNVFLKYYTKNAVNFTCWDPQDRESYLSEIIRVLKIYLPVDNKKQTTEL